MNIPKNFKKILYNNQTSKNEIFQVLEKRVQLMKFILWLAQVITDCTDHSPTISLFQGTKSIYWTDDTSTIPSKAGPKHQRYFPQTSGKTSQ